MKHPFLTNTFHIPWSQLQSKHIEADIEAGLAHAQERLDAIAAQSPDDHSYINTLLAFEDACVEITRAWGLVGHLDSVCNSEELRAAQNKMLSKVSTFFTAIYLNEKLWETIKTYSQSDEAKQLTGIKKRFLEETLEDFRESGADLGVKEKKELTRINQKLAELTQKYSENVLDSTKTWELIIEDETQLAGLPNSAKQAAQEDALKKGHGDSEHPKWRFTQQHPSVLPIMTYLEDDSIRKHVWQGGTEIGWKAPYDNSERIQDILKLRQQRANILGKAQFADLVLSRRMAKNGKTALNFVEDLHQKSKAASMRDFEQLQQHKASNHHDNSSGLEPWDAAYWAEKLRKQEYDFDEEALRPYFAIDSVIEGLFKITSTLYGVSIRPRSTLYIDTESGDEQEHRIHNDKNEAIEVWHPEVKFYDLIDTDGTHIGSFYADWHPRESKRSGAWMNYLRTGGPQADGSFTPHLGLMCGNLTRPTRDKPALMTHREVETIFHEFGHLMHHLLSRVEIPSLSGVNVAWDFVELPSQIMENWCWEREALDYFAKHYETNERMPEDLFKKMLAARNFQQGMQTTRQLSLSKMDLELHLNVEKYTNGDLEPKIKELLKNYQLPYHTQPPSMIRRFGHLFSDATGYAAGYYSYKWAEVLDADAFTRFKKEGILNTKTGHAFRTNILEKGNTEDPEKLFKKFMGRPPSVDALLERSGLTNTVCG